MGNFAIIDLVLLGIVLLFTVVAAIKGFVKAIFGKLCWIVGLICSFLFYKYVMPIMSQYIENPTLAIIASFISVFIVVFLIIKIVEVILSKIFKGEILKSLDHALGAFFGFAEGVAIVFAILFVITQQPWIDTTQLLDGSIVYGLLDPFLQGTHEMLKKESV